MEKAKQKRKQAPRRLQRPTIVVSGLLLIIAIVGALFWMMSNIYVSDLIFLQLNENGVHNIYKLDIDHPSSEARALTTYDDDLSVSNFVVSDDNKWLIYIERLATGFEQQRLVWLDIQTGQTKFIHVCAENSNRYCGNLYLSQDGQYLAFVEVAQSLNHFSLMLINLNEENSVPILIDEDAMGILGFADNTRLHYFGNQGEQVVYDIESGMILDSVSQELDEALYFPSRSTGVELGSTTIRSNGNLSVTGSSIGGNGVVTLDQPDDIISDTRMTTNNPNYDLHTIIRADSIDTYLVDNTTQMESVLFERSQYIVREIIWTTDKKDNSQAAFVAYIYSSGAFEGELWLYDLNTEQLTSLNQIGRSLVWLD